MDSHFHFGAERCTGFFFKKLVCVTYHSGRRWSQRIDNSSSTALGIVHSKPNGSEIRFIILTGALRPTQILLSLCLSAAVWLGILYGSGNLTTEKAFYSIPFSLVITLILAMIDVFIEIATERGHKGRKILKSILSDPSDPFGYLNHLNDPD